MHPADHGLDHDLDLPVPAPASISARDGFTLLALLAGLAFLAIVIRGLVK